VVAAAADPKLLPGICEAAGSPQKLLQLAGFGCLAACLASWPTRAKAKALRRQLPIVEDALVAGFASPAADIRDAAWECYRVHAKAFAERGAALASRLQAHYMIPA
jgi:hypothetical protein